MDTDTERMDTDMAGFFSQQPGARSVDGNV